MHMSTFTVQQEKLKDGKLLLKLAGSLDAFTFEKLDNAAQDFLGSYDIKVIIDISGLTHISSAGAGTLISITESVMMRGGGLVLCNIPDEIEKVFSILGIIAKEPFQNRLLTAAVNEEMASQLLNTL